MQTINKNLFACDYPIVITTNGSIKKNGEAVMGKGVALEAKKRFPELSKLLGIHLSINNNTLGCFLVRDSLQVNGKVITFPVKHKWNDYKADIKLIEKSTMELVNFIGSTDMKIYLPKPGCGCGKLNWDKEVKPILERYLDDRFIVVGV